MPSNKKNKPLLEWVKYYQCCLNGLNTAVLLKMVLELNNTRKLICHQTKDQTFFRIWFWRSDAPEHEKKKKKVQHLLFFMSSSLFIKHYSYKAFRTKINWAIGEWSSCDRAVWFDGGHTNLEDQESRGRPSVTDNQHLKIIVSEKCLRQLLLAIYQYRIILRKLAWWRNSIDVLYWSESESEISRSFETCSMLFLQNSNDPFLNGIVTYDVYDKCKRSAQWLYHG